MNNNELQIFALEIRKAILDALHGQNMGHVGGEMSLAELLACLYNKQMRINPSSPKWEERDRLVLSKGHCGVALHAVLALKGYFPYEWLKTVNSEKTLLPSHCDRNKTPGIDMTTGSLGQGMSLALGMALGLLKKKSDSKVYIILGDGECDEGQIWEGALFASTKKLNNVIAFIDKNNKQLDGYTRDICDVGNLRQKFEDFGWYAQECDGHNCEEINECIENAKLSDKPSMIVLDTVKGKDCIFAESEFYNHHIKFTDRNYALAIDYLNQKIEDLNNERI